MARSGVTMGTLKVGLMALASMGAVVYLSVWVTSNQSGFGDYVTYRAVIRDASGIFPKSSIRVAGVNTGRVVDIALQGNSALVTFELLEDVAVPRDSRLRIRSVGFLGDKYLDVSIGRSQELLGDGDLIQVDEGGGLDTLVKDVSEILVDVRAVVKETRAALAPEDGPSPIVETARSVRELVASAKEAADALRDITVGNEASIGRMVENLEEASLYLRNELDGADEGSAMARVDAILDNVREMSDDLKAIALDVRSGRGTVGKFLREDRIADEVTETLAGVNKLVNRVNMIRTELEVFTGSNSSHGGETHANLRIHPAPERFYLLGIATSEFGRAKERRIVTETDGSRSVTDETVRDKGSYRFNFQIGRRFSRWTFRGGVIESSGGLGIDYNLLSWNQRFSLEAFDYREDVGANIRLATDVQFWNVFYGRTALEDVALGSRSATFSVGLRFADEDIKGLLALFMR